MPVKRVENQDGDKSYTKTVDITNGRWADIIESEPIPDSKEIFMLAKTIQGENFDKLSLTTKKMIAIEMDPRCQQLNVDKKVELIDISRRQYFKIRKQAKFRKALANYIDENYGDLKAIVYHALAKLARSGHPATVHKLAEKFGMLLNPVTNINLNQKFIIPDKDEYNRQKQQKLADGLDRFFPEQRVNLKEIIKYGSDGGKDSRD